MAQPKQKSKQFGYDSVEDTGKRKLRRVSHKSEDDELLPYQRRQQLSNSRDLVRNYAAAAWCVNTHVTAVTNLRFHSRCGDTTLDKRVEELISWWSRPQNCDIAGRHSLSSITRLAESRAILDGDIGLLKLQTGHIQPIEGDRIASIGPTDTTGIDISKYVHGVQVDDGGRPVYYCVCKRQYDSLSHERIIPANWMLLHGYFQRFDQIRGITPLSSALNAFADCAEASGYALARMKIAQLVGLAFMRESAEGVGEEAADGEEYEVDLSRGKSFVLNLDPNDKVEWLESKSPSTEFQAYYREMVSLALKSLHIPSCMLLDGEANYAENRAKLVLWYQYIETRRDVLRNLLNALVAWRLGLFIQDGYLKLPRGRTLDSLNSEWVGAPLPSLNPLDDVRAAIEAINAGITSPQRVVKELTGGDASEILVETAAWFKERQSLGLPPPVMTPTGQQPKPTTATQN
jgi:capsid protein